MKAIEKDDPLAPGDETGLGRALQLLCPGQVFVRVCPYFPFSARVYLNQPYWLALRLQEGSHGLEA